MSGSKLYYLKEGAVTPTLLSNKKRKLTKKIFRASIRELSKYAFATKSVNTEIAKELHAKLLINQKDMENGRLDQHQTLPQDWVTYLSTLYFSSPNQLDFLEVFWNLDDEYVIQRNEIRDVLCKHGGVITEEMNKQLTSSRNTPSGVLQPLFQGDSESDDTSENGTMTQQLHGKACSPPQINQERSYDPRAKIILAIGVALIIYGLICTVIWIYFGNAAPPQPGNTISASPPKHPHFPPSPTTEKEDNFTTDYPQSNPDLNPTDTPVFRSSSFVDHGSTSTSADSNRRKSIEAEQSTELMEEGCERINIRDPKDIEVKIFALCNTTLEKSLFIYFDYAYAWTCVKIECAPGISHLYFKEHPFVENLQQILPQFSETLESLHIQGNRMTQKNGQLLNNSCTKEGRLRFLKLEKLTLSDSSDDASSNHCKMFIALLASHSYPVLKHLTISMITISEENKEELHQLLRRVNGSKIILDLRNITIKTEIFHDKTVPIMYYDIVNLFVQNPNSREALKTVENIALRKGIACNYLYTNVKVDVWECFKGWDCEASVVNGTVTTSLRRIQ